MAIRRRMDFINDLTVHLPWGKVAGRRKAVPLDSHSGSGVPAINALAKGNRLASNEKIWPSFREKVRLVAPADRRPMINALPDRTRSIESGVRI
jgi:hypothetical protein